MLLRKIHCCMLDMLENDGLMIPCDLLNLNVLKCTQIYFSLYEGKLEVHGRYYASNT